jgi:hypothetical protein
VITVGSLASSGGGLVKAESMYSNRFMLEPRKRRGTVLLGAAIGMAVASMSLAGCCNGPCGSFVNCNAPEENGDAYCNEQKDAGADAGVDGGVDAGRPGTGQL